MLARKLWTVISLALAAVAVAAIISACGSGTSASTADVQFIAPQDFKVSDYAGKPLVVNYFGSWCGPCNMEAPELATFSDSKAGQAAFVGIATNDKEGDVVDFMSKYGLKYPVVLDDNSLSSAVGLNGVPTTIFYNASGKEVDRIVGAATVDQFNASYAKTQ